MKPRLLLEVVTDEHAGELAALARASRHLHRVKIGGRRRDHERWAITREDWGGRRTEKAYREGLTRRPRPM